MERWQGRVALVTGASAGIGAELCRVLVQQGMLVVGCARSVDKIEAIAEEDNVKNSPGKLIGFKCDLTKESEILSLFDEIRQKVGRLDVCINNAGLGYDAPLLTGTTSQFRNMLDVNVMALCICTQQSVKMMQELGIDDGQIIHISSFGGHQVPQQGWTGATFYCGTKFMVRALTEGLRRELKALNSHIRVASVSPGLVETQFFETYLKDHPTLKPEDVLKRNPLRSKDVADTVLYILSAPQHVEVHDVIVCPYNSN